MIRTFTEFSAILAVCLVFSGFLIKYFMSIKKINRVEQENRKLQAKLICQQKEIQQLERQYNEISVLRHDHKSQLICLRTLLEQKDFEEAKKYLEKFIGSKNSALIPYIQCSSAVLNAVINEKFSRAEQCGIKAAFRIFTKIPDYLEFDLSIMISNILDNAIEACKKNTESSKIILTISETTGYYRVAVKNTIQVSVLEKNRDLKTNKKNEKLHGWGLKSIENIAQKYTGTLDLYEKNGMFVTSILLTKDERSNMGAKNVTLGSE